MGLKLFSSKGRRLQKNRPLPDGPPPVYTESSTHGSQITIRPAVRRPSEERLSIASTLIVEPSPQITSDVPPPRYTPTASTNRRISAVSAQSSGATRAPRPLRQLRPRLEGPVFPEEPSPFIVPACSSRLERLISSVLPAVWMRIAELLDPADAANLSLTSKTLRYRLGSGPLKALGHPDNKADKIKVLLHMDEQLPDHLLCFPCAQFHLRLRPGDERLQPPNALVTSPIFDCPNATESVVSKARLAHNRTLPFPLLQLASRGERLSPDHGIPLSNLSRRWTCKESEWKHETRAFYHEHRLMFRVTSTHFAPPNLTPSQERLLLYSRADYAPYFSVCEHWYRGDLMKYCKCALSHIPEPSQSIITQLKKAPGIHLSKIHVNQFPKQCEECKPIRRCPYCPTEYLIELRLLEDKKDPIKPFKHAICITRWSDFGECKSPRGIEWASCLGENQMDSFKMIKHATLSTIFETSLNNCAPTSKVMPLKRGGHVY